MEAATYCQIDEKRWDSLSPSALSFIEALALPKVHPQCHSDFNRTEDIPIPVHEMHPNYFYENEMGFASQLFTLFCQIAPALLAMGELWLRLFACIIAPLVGTYLIAKEIRPDGVAADDSSKHLKDWRNERRQVIVMVLGLASSIVIFTDTLYCQAFGRHYGGLLLCVLTFLSARRCNAFKVYKKRFVSMLVVLWCLTLYLYAKSSRGGPQLMDNPGIDIATTKEGLYFSPDNIIMSRVAELWPENERSYTREHADKSPYPTGDILTAFPFLLNSAPDQDYHRLWVQSEVDDEAVAIDIAFPSNGVHRTDKPIYLILHGLTGGSHEEYVRELVGRRTREGHTCIVMIARGMMDTPVFGWNIFHGARTTDVDVSAKAIRKALAPNQILAGVGYSMGAIIISNYVARSGENCHLDAAVAVSGGLDMREQLNFQRSMRLWQPMLAQSLVEDFVKKKFDGRMRQRLTKEQHLFLMRASSVTEVDIHGIVTYNGFDNLTHYYTEMSAMGDTNMFQSKLVNKNVADSGVGRIANVSIPFCVFHALDDPITSWRTMGHDPESLVRSGSGNVMILLTDSGGHVGWPLGINSAANGWKFMSNIAGGFVNSVNTAKLE